MLEYMARFRSLALRLVVALCDLCLLVLAFVLALWLRYDDESLWFIVQNTLLDHLPSILLFSFLYVGLLSLFRMYRYAWRFAGMEAAWSLLLASMVGMAIVAVSYLLQGDVLPRSVFVMWWVLSTMFIGGLRVLLRLAMRHRNSSAMTSDDTGDDLTPTRAIIVGAAEYAAWILKSVANTHSLRNYRILGVLDDRADKTGLFYGGVRVLGTTALLKGYLDRQEVDEVIFPLSDEADGSTIRSQVLECRRRRIRVKVIPNLAEMLTRPTPVKLEDISVGDLLRRPMRSLDTKTHGTYLTGKRVLITGAGGSIGSEICRQVMHLCPAEIILLGHGENSIFRIDQELRQSFPEMSSNIFPIIASIKNKARIERIFARFKPQIVFHAGAHKHLPLMEYNVCEAVHNNVIGTHNVVQACIKYNVERMLQISTDKAADPTCVMGATKWLCEAVVKSAAQDHAETNFVCVRFGNVLGSRGSVIPVFDKQIKNGGPVTVTHPEMTRYFMTIPEAVRLVIQAGGVGKSGCVYLLDMGKPVKILDLAEDMIRLNGYEPNVDIPITFTGIRPGEKMHEQLASSSEQVQPSKHEGLNVVMPEHVMSNKEIVHLIEKLRRYVEQSDGGAVISLFEEIIPGYASGARAVFTRLVS